MNPAGADLDAVRRFALDVWKYKEGELVSVMIHLGDRLGIYRAMESAGLMSAADVAKATGTDERWIREWLYGQAAAGLLNHVDGRFELTDVGAAVLADEDSGVFFAAGAFTGTTEPGLVEQIATAMRSGGGFTYEDQGKIGTRTTERMSRPSYRGFFVPAVLPAIPGLVKRLEQGATGVDVGCGSGAAVEVIGETYPASRLLGLDPSSTAITRARERTSHLDNVQFEVGFAEDLAGEFDVAFALDTLHDMPRPDLALAAIRRTLKPDGVLVIKDIKSQPGFENNRKNPLLAMQYGYSLTSCLPSGLSEPGGLGLGTLGFNPEVAEQMVTDAGFSRFTMHDLDDPTQLYYEARI